MAHCHASRGMVLRERQLGEGHEAARLDVLGHRDQLAHALSRQTARSDLLDPRPRPTTPLRCCSSPEGASVDMRRPSSHWSSRYSSGHGARNVKVR